MTPTLYLLAAAVASLVSSVRLVDVTQKPLKLLYPSSHELVFVYPGQPLRESAVLFTPPSPIMMGEPVHWNMNADGTSSNQSESFPVDSNETSSSGVLQVDDHYGVPWPASYGRFRVCIASGSTTSNAAGFKLGPGSPMPLALALDASTVWRRTPSGTGGSTSATSWPENQRPQAASHGDSHSDSVEGSPVLDSVVFEALAQQRFNSELNGNLTPETEQPPGPGQPWAPEAETVWVCAHAATSGSSANGTGVVPLLCPASSPVCLALPGTRQSLVVVLQQQELRAPPAVTATPPLHQANTARGTTRSHAALSESESESWVTIDSGFFVFAPVPHLAVTSVGTASAGSLHRVAVEVQVRTVLGAVRGPEHEPDPALALAVYATGEQRALLPLASAHRRREVQFPVHRDGDGDSESDWEPASRPQATSASASGPEDSHWQHGAVFEWSLELVNGPEPTPLPRSEGTSARTGATQAGPPRFQELVIDFVVATLAGVPVTWNTSITLTLVPGLSVTRCCSR